MPKRRSKGAVMQQADRGGRRAGHQARRRGGRKRALIGHSFEAAGVRGCGGARVLRGGVLQVAQVAGGRAIVGGQACPLWQGQVFALIGAGRAEHVCSAQQHAGGAAGPGEDHQLAARQRQLRRGGRTRDDVAGAVAIGARGAPHQVLCGRQRAAIAGKQRALVKLPPGSSESMSHKCAGGQLLSDPVACAFEKCPEWDMAAA